VCVFQCSVVNHYKSSQNRFSINWQQIFRKLSQTLKTFEKKTSTKLKPVWKYGKIFKKKKKLPWKFGDFLQFCKTGSL
jgi:hypothetical protein